MKYWLVALLVLSCSLGGYAQPRIQVGDRLLVAVAENKELTGEYMVSADGTILMPFIGAVEVVGMTTEQATSKIRKILADQRVVLDPRVTVSFAEERTGTVEVSGAVASPGDYPVTARATLDDVLALARPLKDADLSAVRLTLPDGSVQSVNYEAYRTTGAKAGNPPLRAGSKVYVTIRPRVEEVTVLGAVVKPGIVKYTERMTLADAISLAGGTKGDADLARIRIQRKDGRTEEINLTQVGGAVPLERGDQVFVPMRATSAYVMVRGAVGNPGLVPYKERMTVTEALYAAGGPLDSARLDRIEVKRIEGGRDRTFRIDLNAVLRGNATDVELMPGDTVVVHYPPKGISFGEAVNYAWILLSLILILRRL